MSPFVLIGAGVGVGLFLILRGVVFVPASLATTMRRMERIGTSVADQDRASTAGLSARFADLLASRLGANVERNLAIMERTPARFAIEKLSMSIALGLVATLCGVALKLAGSSLSGGFIFLAVFLFAAIGFALPDFTLRAAAAERRDGFRHALSSYLDLVNVLLAGGAGTETALEAAAEAGDGWAFNQIRTALLRARTMRQTPWTCFTELSEQIGVIELTEIAASVRLAGEQGARIKLSLAARASALRAHQMARIEADAQAATERMGLPTVLMFLGFMVLLGYPAMQQIVRGF
jgi:tight adherence protein C